MSIICGRCGRDLSLDELVCEACHPLPPAKLSNLGAVAMTAAVMDQRTSGPLDGAVLHAAARAFTKEPS